MTQTESKRVGKNIPDICNLYKIYKRKTTKFMNEIKGDLNKWRDHHIHGLEDPIKMSFLPKLNHRFNELQLKSQQDFLWI